MYCRCAERYLFLKWSRGVYPRNDGPATGDNAVVGSGRPWCTTARTARVRRPGTRCRTGPFASTLYGPADHKSTGPDPSRGYSLILLHANSDVALGPRLRAMESALALPILALQEALQELDVADRLAVVVVHRIGDELGDRNVVQVERRVRT